MVKLVELALCALITITLWPASASGFQDASAASLTVDDLEPGFLVHRWETYPLSREAGGSAHAVIFQQLASRTANAGGVIVSIFVSGTPGVPIESDVEALLVEGADPGGRVGPREFPFGPVGDSARWFRAETSERLFQFTVVFRVGDHLASAKLVRPSESRASLELLDYATLVAERLRAL